MPNPNSNPNRIAGTLRTKESQAEYEADIASKKEAARRRAEISRAMSVKNEGVYDELNNPSLENYSGNSFTKKDINTFARHLERGGVIDENLFGGEKFKQYKSGVQATIIARANTMKQQFESLESPIDISLPENIDEIVDGAVIEHAIQEIHNNFNTKVEEIDNDPNISQSIKNERIGKLEESRDITLKKIQAMNNKPTAPGAETPEEVSVKTKDVTDLLKTMEPLPSEAELAETAKRREQLIQDIQHAKVMGLLGEPSEEMGLSDNLPENTVNLERLPKELLSTYRAFEVNPTSFTEQELIALKEGMYNLPAPSNITDEEKNSTLNRPGPATATSVAAKISRGLPLDANEEAFMSTRGDEVSDRLDYLSKMGNSITSPKEYITPTSVASKLKRGVDLSDEEEVFRQQNQKLVEERLRGGTPLPAGKIISGSLVTVDGQFHDGNAQRIRDELEKYETETENPGKISGEWHDQNADKIRAKIQDGGETGPGQNAQVERFIASLKGAQTKENPNGLVFAIPEIKQALSSTGKNIENCTYDELMEAVATVNKNRAEQGSSLIPVSDEANFHDENAQRIRDMLNATASDVVENNTSPDAVSTTDEQGMRKMIAEDIGYVEAPKMVPETDLGYTVEKNADGSETHFTPYATITLPPQEQVASVNAVAAAEAAVANGTQAEATVEIPAGDIGRVGEYLEDLQRRHAQSTYLYGVDAKATKKLDNEIESYNRKEKKFTDSRDALTSVVERLQNPDISPEQRAKLEKQQAILEKMATRAEGLRQTQDRSWGERGMDWFKKNIAERYRNLGTFKKIGLGIALIGGASVLAGPAGAVAVSYLMRTGAWYSLYQGSKAGKIKSLANQIEALRQKDQTPGNVAAIDDLLVQKTILERGAAEGWSKGDFARLGITALIAFGVPAAVQYSGVADGAADFIQDKFNGLGQEMFGGPHDGAMSAAQESIPLAADPHAAVAAAVAAQEGAANHFATVEPGDNMYKILTEQLNLRDAVTTDGARYNLIENLLQDARANPAAFGIESGDVNVLHPGDKINIDAFRELLQNKVVEGDHLIEHANKMHSVVAERLAENMPAAAKEGFAAAAVSAKTEAVAQAATGAGSSVSTGGGVGGPTIVDRGPTIITGDNSGAPAQPVAPADGGAGVTYEPVGAAENGPVVTYEPLAYTATSLQSYGVTYANLRQVGLLDAQAFMSGEGVNGDPIASRLARFVADLSGKSNMVPTQGENVLAFIARATATPLSNNSSIA